MKNKIVKIVFDDGVTQEAVDKLVDEISVLLEAANVTAVQFVGEEDSADFLDAVEAVAADCEIDFETEYELAEIAEAKAEAVAEEE